MDKVPLVVIGSARKNGDTHKLVKQLFKGRNIHKVDLLDFKVYPYSYSGKYPADDQFQALVKQLLSHASIVFATPVYWYAMSGAMKTFFDRLTDIVTVDKIAGRQMKGRNTSLIATGTDDTLPAGFEVPFALTSDYFDMQFKGSYYCSAKNLSTLPGKDVILKKLFNEK